MDIRNIKLSIVQVAIIVAQAVTVVWAVAKMYALMENLSSKMTEISVQQDREAQDNKIWKAKIEADLADLKVRQALLEAKVNSMKYEN
jgi:hypothetical protein